MILLTGSTGFLGSRLLRQLVDEQFPVVCCKRKTSDMKRVCDFQEKCYWVNIDECEIEDIFQKWRIDIVIHCATHYGRDGKNSFEVYNSNLIFPLKLVEYADKYGCKVFINTSTFFVREIVNLWQCKERIYMDSYVKSKFVFSNILSDNVNQLKMSVVNMQLEHIYGNDGRSSKFVDYLLENLCANVDSIPLTEGTQCRDWIYVDDVISAYMVLLHNIDLFKTGEYYHYEVGTGKATSLREFVIMAKELTNSTTRLDFGARTMELNELMYSCANREKLCALGWEPKTDIATGIQKILQNREL